MAPLGAVTLAGMSENASVNEQRDIPASEPTEQTAEQAAQPIEPAADPRIDAVLGSLDDLDEDEVATHVAVFERAHDTLRRVLDGAGQPVPHGLRPQS